MKIGLVDKLGGYDTALETLKQLCKDRYGSAADFAVVDTSAQDMFAGLLDFSRRSFRFSLMSDDPLQVENKLMPEFLSARFYHVPLWMMQ